MINMEGAKIEKSKIPDTVIARGRKEAELKEVLGMLDEIVGRAEASQGDLKDSIVLLRATLSKMYEDFLRQVRDGDEKGALDALEDSGIKAENVRNLAVSMETLMDDFGKNVGKLRGQIQN